MSDFMDTFRKSVYMRFQKLEKALKELNKSGGGKSSPEVKALKDSVEAFSKNFESFKSSFASMEKTVADLNKRLSKLEADLSDGSSDSKSKKSAGKD